MLAILKYQLQKINAIDFIFPECKRPNEEYQCGSACQTTCSNLGVACPIVNIRCNDACYCIEGFARLDAKGQQDDTAPCVEIKNCPKN